LHSDADHIYRRRGIVQMTRNPTSRALLDDPDESATDYWRWQIGSWAALFMSQFFVSWRIWSVAPFDAFINNSLLMIAFVGATHALRAYSKHQQWVQLSARALFARLFLSGFVLSTLVTVAHACLDLALSRFDINLRQPSQASFELSTVSIFLNAQVFFYLWIAGYFGISIMRQRQHVVAEEARLRAALRTAELGLLKSQLNPHFLFNALNTVRALISESPERAQLAVTQLARTLRYSLNSARDEIVDLETELEIVEDYLGIETLRLAERLTIVKEIAPNTLQARIPIMLLQTLVENAVKHGISQLPAGGTLTVAAHMDSNILVIEVANDRPLIKSGSIPSDRVGLANASERLRLMIGPAASLALDLSHAQRAKATVRIPQAETGK